MTAGLTPRLRVSRHPETGEWAVWVHHDDLSQPAETRVRMLLLTPTVHWSEGRPEGSLWPEPTFVLPYGQAESLARRFAEAFAAELEGGDAS